jgi:hypothetical protein
VYRYGLPRGALGSTGRELASVTASTDLLELEQHGYETDEPVVLRALEGGTMAGGLTAGTTYYVIRVTDSTFKLAAAPGGGAVPISSDGEGMVVTQEIDVDDILSAVSRLVDDHLPAHAVPLTAPYPETVIDTVAMLAAKRIQNITGVKSTITDEQAAEAWKRLERWAKGVPIRDARATAATNCAVRATLSTTADARGWGSGSLP